MATRGKDKTKATKTKSKAPKKKAKAAKEETEVEETPPVEAQLEEPSKAEEAKELAAEETEKISEKTKPEVEEIEEEAEPEEEVEEKAKPKEAAEEEEEEELEIVEEKFYDLNMRRIWSIPRGKRTPKAVRFLREFVSRRMKTDDIAISEETNQMLWARGISKPPRKIRVRAVKDKDGHVIVFPGEGK